MRHMIPFIGGLCFAIAFGSAGLYCGVKIGMWLFGW